MGCMGTKDTMERRVVMLVRNTYIESEEFHENITSWGRGEGP
jgi:hypothetical protein